MIVVALLTGVATGLVFVALMELDLFLTRRRARRTAHQRHLDRIERQLVESSRPDDDCITQSVFGPPSIHVHTRVTWEE